MLLPQPVEDPLRRVPLLGWAVLVFFQNGVDYAEPRPQLGPFDRLLPLVAWRHRIPQHLAYGLARDPKLLRYRTLTPALHQPPAEHVHISPR
jgi:hypothetical protein